MQSASGSIVSQVGDIQLYAFLSMFGVEGPVRLLVSPGPSQVIQINYQCHCEHDSLKIARSARDPAITACRLYLRLG